MAHIVLNYCKYCGNENVLMSEASSSSGMKAFQSKVEKNVSCPICHRKYDHDATCFFDGTTSLAKNKLDDYIAEKFEEMKSLRYAAEEISPAQESHEIAVECMSGDQIEAQHNEKFLTKMKDKENLKKYLSIIIQHYGALYYLESELESLIEQKRMGEKALDYDIEAVKEEEQKQKEKVQAHLREVKKMIRRFENPNKQLSQEELEELGIVKPARPEKPMILSNPEEEAPVMPLEPVYKTETFWNSWYTKSQNEMQRVVYLGEMREYKKRLAAYEETEAAKTTYKKEEREYKKNLKLYEEKAKEAYLQKKEEELQKLQKEQETAEAELAALKGNTKNQIADMQKNHPSVWIESTLSQRQKEIEKQMTQVSVSLNKAYSYDVIYPKYRDYISICSFYEAFDAGRCDSLDGPFGAYNIYEGDVKANIIMSQLAQVVSNLEDIKKNQNKIYTELQSINGNIRKTNQHLNTMVSGLYQSGLGMNGRKELQNDYMSGCSVMSSQINILCQTNIGIIF